MYNIYILVLVSCIYVESCTTSVPVPLVPKPVPAPRIKSTTMTYPNILTVFWEPIPDDQVQKEYPLIGYKVSLWADFRVSYVAVKTPQSLMARGTLGSGYEYSIGEKIGTFPSEFGTGYQYRPHSKIPETAPETKTVGRDVTTANFTIDSDVAYQVRVMAFNKVSDGPYSFPETVKLLSSRDKH